MSASAYGRYVQLMCELLNARRDAGGTLPDEEESRHVSELDDIWNAMTVAEREQAERELGRKPTNASQ